MPSRPCYNRINVAMRKGDMQGRLQVFDLLRVLATLAVIGIHVSADYAGTSAGGFLFNQVVRFAVPMFIIISGFLLYYQDITSVCRESVGRFYRKRFGKILWPYVLWTLFYTLVTQYLLHTWPDTRVFMAALGRHLLWGTGAYHLYFMVIIIQCYLLYPLLKAWIEKHAVSFVISLLSLCLFCQVVLYLNTIGRYSLPGVVHPQVYLVAFPIWIGYFGLGMYMAQFRTRIESALASGSGRWGMLWVISMAFLLWDGHTTASYASSGKPTIMIYAIMSFLFFYSLTLKYGGKGLPITDWLSRQSFLIYLSHPVVLLFLQRIVHKMGVSAAWEGPGGMMMLYVLTVVITVTGVYCVRHAPLLWLLGGQSYRPRY